MAEPVPAEETDQPSLSPLVWVPGLLVVVTLILIAFGEVF